MYECSGCARQFHGLTAFDRHRTGSFARLGQRRCLSEQEMSGAGLRPVESASGVFWCRRAPEKRRCAQESALIRV